MSRSACRHQFFETNKEKKESGGCNCKLQSTEIHYHIAFVEKYGARVVCALCGEKRIVWQDGKIDVFDEKDLLRV